MPDTLTIPRDTSPWDAYTGSADEEQAGYHVTAATIAPDWERLPWLADFALGDDPLLAIDRAGRRVLVSAAFFDDVQRPDLTRALGHVAVTRVRGALLADPARLVRFLLVSHLLRTVAHVEATVTCAEEGVTDGVFRSRWTGSHVYFTSRRNEGRLDFAVEVDLTSGAVAVRT